jgi:Ca-activated chloride channel family protein
MTDYYRGHIGDLIGGFRSALAQWEHDDSDLLRKLLMLTWDRLDKETRKQFSHLMINMIYRVSRSVTADRGIPTGEIMTLPFNFQSDEIDLDRTFDGKIENPRLSYDNIFVLDRKKRKKAAVIIMDASGSMYGENLSMAAIAVASLAMNLDLKDEYGVVFFSEKVNIFKHIDQKKHIDEVIKSVLDILPEGRTNIELGLSAGFQEIQRSSIADRMGILLTDGWQNIGRDPIVLARRFPKLHVINLPGGSSELSQNISKAGKGNYIMLKNIFDVPGAIFRCLN